MSSIGGEDRPAEEGSVLMLAVVLAAAFSVLSLSLWGWAASGSRRAAVEIARPQALYLGESGVADALHRLNSGALDVPAPGGEGEFSSGASLDWAQGSYRVVISRPADGEQPVMLVQSTGLVGSVSREVTVTVRRRFDPAVVFRPGRQLDGTYEGVVATDPADPRYDPDYAAPPVLFELPPLPSPVSQWDYRESLASGTYVFDMVEVKDKESLVIQADGPVDVYVRGYVRVGRHAELRSVGAGRVRFFVYGQPPGADGWVVALDTHALVHTEGPSVWTVGGPVRVGSHARFTQESAQAPATLNISGSLVIEPQVTLGSPPSEGEAPRLLVVLEPGESAQGLELGVHGAMYAMVYAPEVDVTMLTHSRLEGALVCHSLSQDSKASCTWNPAIAEQGPSSWEPAAGWWGVEPGTWWAR